MVTGGNTEEKTSIYMEDGGWQAGPDMNIPRGYQSTTIMSDGHVRLFRLLYLQDCGRSTCVACMVFSAGAMRACNL